MKMPPSDLDSIAVSIPRISWWRLILTSQRREMRRIVTELLAMRGLMPLLMKSRNGGQWTSAEREELISHMRRLAHLSPYLLFLILPGSALLLPLYAWWLDRRRGERPNARPPATPVI